MSDDEKTERADIATRFQPGNSAWRARSTHGRNPIFPDADTLESACEQYFEWVEKNPLIGVDTVKFQGVGDTMEVPKMRAMTIMGLCNFLDIDTTTWADYRTKSPDFSRVCERTESIIRQQKFEGASADLLNPAIIARDLGLADKQEIKQGGELKITSKEMSLEEAARVLQDNLKSLNG